jgi:DNA polymerase-3 subunit delta
MIVKSFNLNFQELLKKKFTLLYGENISLISEIENKITTEAKATKNLTIKKYQEEYLLQNKDIFDQLINAESLFGDQEMVVISKSTDKIIEIYDEKNAQDNDKRIIFLSGPLTKKSKLRNLAEASTIFTCIACYNDTSEQLQSILFQKLKDNKISVSREFINSIFEINSLNRQDINDAVSKIQLIQNTSKITEDNLKNIFHSSENSNNFEIINFCLLGDKKNINKVLSNIYAQGINFNEILAALKYKVKKLIDILESDIANKDPNQLVESFKPPIFWKEKSMVKEQLRRWDKSELKQLMEIVYDIEVECKKNYDVSNIILQQFIVSTSNKSCLDNRYI